MTTTTFELDGYRLVKNLGVVRGITVHSRSIFGTRGDNRVSFSYRDLRRDNEQRIATLDAHTFIARFLLPVLPHGFMRIRHYGFLASRCKTENLRRCRVLLGQAADPPIRPRLTVAQWLKTLLGIDVDRCPACGERTLLRTKLQSRIAAYPEPVMGTS